MSWHLYRLLVATWQGATDRQTDTEWRAAIICTNQLNEPLIRNAVLCWELKRH